AVLNDDKFKKMTKAQRRAKILETIRDLAKEKKVDLTKVTSVKADLKPIARTYAKLQQLFKDNNVSLGPKAGAPSVQPRSKTGGKKPSPGKFPDARPGGKGPTASPEQGTPFRRSLPELQNREKPPLKTVRPTEPAG